jgi:hypothetical protein
MIVTLTNGGKQVVNASHGEKACNLHSQADFEGLTHNTTTTTTTITTNTYVDIVPKELVGFQWFPISCKCVLCWWQKEEHKFSTIVI